MDEFWNREDPISKIVMHFILAQILVINTTPNHNIRVYICTIKNIGLNLVNV